MNSNFIIIGITDSASPCFNNEVKRLISISRVFSGGRRHHDIMAPMLPKGALWIDITVPLAAVFQEYANHHEPIVVFASGDPLFFGFANTVRRFCPNAHIRLVPAFHSLQTLAHRLLLPYHDMRIVSLTGRPWHEFDKALIECAPKIGVLTDHKHSPQAIARRMLDYGFAPYYTMTIGERLGSATHERITTLPATEVAAIGEGSAAPLPTAFAHPNCLILQATKPRYRRYGLPDSEFALLNGRAKMITKMPIRLLSLQALQLTERHVLWDIGFCTGSVSIEARLQFPHLQVLAFEVRPEGLDLLHTNARHFGAPGIVAINADFLAINIAHSTNADNAHPTDADNVCQTIPEHLLSPDAVFIGGHGGRLSEIMQRIDCCAAEGCMVVMNSVTPESKALFLDTAAALHWQPLPPTHIALDSYNPIDILAAKVTKQRQQ